MQFSFYFSTGDNFYPNGVSKMFDKQFTTSYENIYNFTSLANTRTLRYDI